MKVVKNILNKIINSNTIIFAIYIIIVEIIFKLLVGTFRFDYSILRIIISSSVISLILNLITNKHLKKVLCGLLSIVIGIYGLVQLGFNNFLGSYMSVNTSSQLGKVTDYISDYISSFKANYYLILIPMILYLIYIIIKKDLHHNFSIKHLAIIPILVICYYLTLTLGFMQNKYQYASNISLFKNPSIATVSVNQFGVTVFGFLDIKSKFIESEQTTAQVLIDEPDPNKIANDEEEAFLKSLIGNEEDSNLNTLNKYFYSKETDIEGNIYTGMFEGKNLIVVLMESVNTLMYNGEYFPTLYKMYNEGISFTNNYSPRTSCSTGNNEFSTLTSLYAIGNTCTSNIYKSNSYFNSIFNLFNNAEYNTSAFHNYDEKYYSRSVFLPNMGASFYKDANSLGIAFDTAYKEWPSDVELIEKSYPLFSTSTTTSNKYMTYLVSVTTHQPYAVSSTEGDKYLNMFDEIDASISIKRYYSKMKVLDDAMETLLTKLENDGTLDDTVIVLFGDHYPYGIKTSELQEMFDYDISENKEIERTPFIIYNSATSPLKVDKYTTYLDILPTLANLFNIKTSSRYYMGEDALDENYSNIAVFSDGSWQSEYAFYDVETSKISYTREGYIYTEEEINQINTDINQKITMSNLAITKNYFNYLEVAKEEYLVSLNSNISEDIIIEDILLDDLEN